MSGDIEPRVMVQYNRVELNQVEPSRAMVECNTVK